MRISDWSSDVCSSDLALWLFERSALDLAVLEIGLGGRLDAVNVVDPDVAMITTVDLDHQDWLGDDRELIGFEKAGIARPWKPLVLGETDPPSSVLRHAYAIGAPADRKSVVSGKSVSGRVDHGGRRFIKKKKN